jgi:hypothetical protein
MNDHQSMFEWLALMMMECQGLDIFGVDDDGVSGTGH